MTTLTPSEFGVTQAIQIGDVKYPLYDLSKLRAGLLFTENVPPEIQENVNYSLNNINSRLEVSSNIIDEPVAIVGYGPTLKEYWPKLKEYKHIISTSGAHKFLLDRDIVPTYHVDIDFRERKAVHTKEPHPDVQYLFGSIVHKATLDNVLSRGYPMKLWHIKLPGIKYPDNEVVLEGYWDVGQEAILVAKALGYRNLHLFGYDYAYEVETGSTHAGFHNGPPNLRVFAKIGERYYQTSDSLARGVMVFTKLMEDNSDLSLTIHGQGLLSSYLDYHFKSNDARQLKE